jgi:hypothetical protein
VQESKLARSVCFLHTLLARTRSCRACKSLPPLNEGNENKLYTASLAFTERERRRKRPLSTQPDAFLPPQYLMNYILPRLRFVDALAPIHTSEGGGQGEVEKRVVQRLVDAE